MDNFGERLAELRKNLNWSQLELASRVGVSQTKISRLEASADYPQDIRLLAKISKALSQPLSELVPDDYLQNYFSGGNEDSLFAFCPNPLCDANDHKLGPNGAPTISWKSWQAYPAEAFSEVNFCARCGEELVKECPGCKRRFGIAKTRFCITCGTQICDRPTAEDWERIGRRLKPKQSEKSEELSEGDNIPF